MEIQKIYKLQDTNNLNKVFKHQKSEDFCGLKVSTETFKPKSVINNIQVPGMTRKGNAGLPIFSKKNYRPTKGGFIYVI